MVEITEQLVKTIKAAVGYKGRKVAVTKFLPMRLNSYWSDGSRDYFFFLNERGQLLRKVPQNGTPFDRLNISCEKLEEGEILVQTSIIRGKNGTLRIFLNQ